MPVFRSSETPGEGQARDQRALSFLEEVVHRPVKIPMEGVASRGHVAEGEGKPGKGPEIDRSLEPSPRMIVEKRRRAEREKPQDRSAEFDARLVRSFSIDHECLVAGG